MNSASFVKAGSLRAAFSFGLACSLAAGAGLSFAKVQPPPLPPGSSMVRVKPGLSDDEEKRQVRAHHNKTHYKKDLAKDDSVPGNKGNGNGQQNNAGKKP